MVKYKIYHFCLSIQSPTTDKIHSVCLAHVGRRLTMLKGTQDPSIQVNSGQVTLVFLLPGGAGETVLSEQNKISNNYQTERDYTHYHEVCEYGRVGCRLFLSSFPYFFLSLSLCFPSFISSLPPFFEHFVRSCHLAPSLHSIHPHYHSHLSLLPISGELTTHQLIFAPRTVWNAVAHLRRVHAGAVVTWEAAWTRRYPSRAWYTHRINVSIH